MSDLCDLTTRWVQGWAAARALPSPQDLGDGLRVRCSQPGRDFEIFARHADDDPDSVARLAVRMDQEPSVTWLTVPTTRPEQVASVFQAGGLSLLRRSELMMTVDLHEQPHHEVPAPYHVKVEPTESAVHIELRDAGGELAARGAVGLVGADAVVDRILTWPAHRRRGLASAVMGALTSAAVQRGARRGILIASEEGQPLYRGLGWSAVADVLIAAVPGTAYPEG